ncbi:acetyl-CoA acetyltransferase [Microbacterium foliorum]|uniref:Acetyl-CoA acetyltransferase n=1 Tax=Microbacterium foliorum TaxID=104336 RepID=A0ABU1HQ80_9MICO|nr:acetyl-CoA acetyltransferase [Microbacterium foliorum]
MLQEVTPHAHGEQPERALGQCGGPFDGRVEAAGLALGASGIRHILTLSTQRERADSVKEPARRRQRARVRDDREALPA